MASLTGGATASERVDYLVAVKQIAHGLRVSIIAHTAGTPAPPIRFLERRVLVEILLPAPGGALAQLAGLCRIHRAGRRRE